MRLTSNLMKNLNKPYWDRRVWEIGYRGTPICTRPGFAPPKPVLEKDIASLREKLQREYSVMQWLATPYLSEEQERPYVEKNGTVIDQWKAEKVAQKHAKMPNKVKVYKVDGTLEKRCANVGNNLHSHRTVEGSLQELIRRNRWD